MSLRVPYVTAWTGEYGLVVRHDPQFGQAALFSAAGSRGRGEPRWGRISEERQRECVVGRRCSVCGEPIGPSPGFALTGLRPIDIDGRQVWSTAEPLVCRVCAGQALRVCPKLRALHTAVALHPLAVEAYSIAAQILVRESEPEDDDQRQINAALDEARVESCVGFLEVIVTRAQALSPVEIGWLAEG